MSCDQYIFDDPIYSGAQYIFDTVCYEELGRTKGGAAAGERERRQRKQRERLEAQQRLIRSVKPLYDDPDLNDLLPEDISELTRDVVTGGKLYVGDTEVEFAETPKPPELLLRSVKDIKQEITDQLTQELAIELRRSEAQRYIDELIKYQQAVRSFEEEFMVFLLLLED